MKLLLDSVWELPKEPTQPSAILPTVQTRHSGLLAEKDIFRIGADYFRITRLHEDHVECWGGSKDPRGSRAFRAFTYEYVRDHARPLKKGQRWVDTDYANIMMEGRRESRSR